MIFATVGTSTFPFERLIQRLDDLHLESELVVQYGASSVVPRALVATSFLPYEAVVQRMRDARVVIVHGGAGSILTAFHVGRHPIVVPRRKEFGEAVDDHQLELAEQLAQSGRATIVEDVADLTRDLLDRSRASVPPAAADSPLVRELRKVIVASLATRQR